MSNIAVITGAAGALGAAVARVLVRTHRLALLDVPQSHERLDGLARELAPALPFARDLSTDAAWAAVLAEIEAAFGGLPDAAALCAGGWTGGSPLHASPDDAAYRRMMALNADTVHQALRMLLPGMVANQRGSVVVIGARPVERPWTATDAAAYAASKAAAVALAQVAAQEVLHHGVRVNAVLPSVIDTPPNRASMPDADPTRWVSLPSLAGIVAFLLSDDARDVSGAALPVYGRA